MLPAHIVRFSTYMHKKNAWLLETFCIRWAKAVVFLRPRCIWMLQLCLQRSGFDGLSVTPCFREHLHSSGRRTGHRWDRLTETRSVLLHRLSASRVCLSMLLDPSLSGRAQLCMRRPLLCWEAACAALMRRPHQVVSERLGRTGHVVFLPDGNAVVHNTANSFIKPGFKGYVFFFFFLMLKYLFASKFNAETRKPLIDWFL